MAAVICMTKNDWPGLEIMLYIQASITPNDPPKYWNLRNLLYIHEINRLNIEIHEHSESPAVPPNVTFFGGGKRQKKFFGANFVPPNLGPSLRQCHTASFWCRLVQNVGPYSITKYQRIDAILEIGIKYAMYNPVYEVYLLFFTRKTVW